MSCRRPRFHLAGVKRTLVSLDSPAYIEFTYFSGRARWSVSIVCERSALWTADNKGQDRRAKRFRLARGHLDDGHAFAALLGRGELEALDQRVLRQQLPPGPAHAGPPPAGGGPQRPIRSVLPGPLPPPKLTSTSPRLSGGPRASAAMGTPCSQTAAPGLIISGRTSPTRRRRRGGRRG